MNTAQDLQVEVAFGVRVKMASGVIGDDKYWNCRQWQPLEQQLWNWVWLQTLVP